MSLRELRAGVSARMIEDLCCCSDPQELHIIDRGCLCPVSSEKQGFRVILIKHAGLLSRKGRLWAFLEVHTMTKYTLHVCASAPAACWILTGEIALPEVISASLCLNVYKLMPA